MTTTDKIPAGYLDRKASASFLDISAAMFDRIAPTEFKHSRIRVGKGNAYYYSEAELQTYRQFREKRKQAGLEELTWKQLVDKNEELSVQNADSKQKIKILLWVLRSPFSAGEETMFSAAHMAKNIPKKYEQAKQILIGFGLDIEELRQRFGSLNTEVAW